MSGLRFHEEMGGWLGRGEIDPNQGVTTGKADGTPLRFGLDIEVPDVGAFLRDPRMQARASGWLESPLVGGRRPVRPGSTFNLFVDGPGGTRMLYRLLTDDAAGHPVTLSGFKVLHDDPGFDLWSDTTALRASLLRGHLDEAQEAARRPAAVLAAGILEITVGGFARLLTTLRGSGADGVRFGVAFLGELWRLYRDRGGPGRDAFPDPTPHTPFDEPPSWERLRARGVHPELVEARAGDGHRLRLHHFRGDHEPVRGPVLLIAGTGVRANVFAGAPVRRTVVDTLVGAGYDVWVEDWRASIDFPAADYTLDDAAVFDHPVAVREVLRRTGAPSCKAIVHCQGSTGFVMSALAGLVPDVRTVVSNAVSLHPVVTPASHVKLGVMVPLTGTVLSGVDPQWAVRGPSPVQAAVGAVARLVRRECREPACAMTSFMYGVGGDILWRHALLDHETHHWLAREFGYVPMTFFRQMARSVRAGQLVPVDGLPQLPARFDDTAPPEDQTWTFLAGSANRCFLPESQRRTHAWFEARRPGGHAVEELPGYSHLDVFIGARAPDETHPRLLRALEREPA
jgi:hypothetical protein